MEEEKGLTGRRALGMLLILVFILFNGYLYLRRNNRLTPVVEREAINESLKVQRNREQQRIDSLNRVASALRRDSLLLQEEIAARDLLLQQKDTQLLALTEAQRRIKTLVASKVPARETKPMAASETKKEAHTVPAKPHKKLSPEPLPTKKYTIQEEPSGPAAVASAPKDTAERKAEKKETVVVKVEKITAGAYRGKKGQEEETHKASETQKLRVCLELSRVQHIPFSKHTVYLAIINAKGELLGGQETFLSEGLHLPYTLKQKVFYEGKTSGICLHWSGSATYLPGNYEVKVYMDGNKLGECRFTLK